jgi:hypothetical protein
MYVCMYSLCFCGVYITESELELSNSEIGGQVMRRSDWLRDEL